MSQMHLRQLRFTYSPWGPFAKKQTTQKLKETRDSQFIYKNELDKALFQQDVACGGFKDLPRTAAPNKVLHDKPFNIA